MFKKLSIVALFASVLLLAGCGQQTMVNPDELPDVIKIGYIGPLTGNAASYGQDTKNGIALYFKENPEIAGKTVELIYEDGKCNGQDASAAAQKLVTVDKVQVILGGQCSGETLAAAPIAEANKVLLFSPIASSPEITTAGDYIFRVYPSDAQVGAAMMDDVADQGYQKAAILSEQTDYSQGYRGALKARMEAYPDMELAVDEAYAVDNTDFRTLLAKVQESGADVLLSTSQTSVGHAFLVKQAKELGLEIQIYGTDTIDGPDFFGTAKDAGEGVIQVVPAVDPSRKGYKEFSEAIESAQSSPIFQALAYDAAAITAQAIATVGYNGTALKDYLYDMPTFNGVAGDHKFDEYGDNQVPSKVKIARGGKFVLRD